MDCRSTAQVWAVSGRIEAEGQRRDRGFSLSRGGEHGSAGWADVYPFILVIRITLLTTALAGQGMTADPATGLVYQGNGRFYDPALGRPLQPNPSGSVPTLPQSLSRYRATALGAPGVAEGLEANSFLGSWLRDNWYRQGASALTACATCVLSEIKPTETLFRLRVTLGAKTFQFVENRNLAPLVP